MNVTVTRNFLLGACEMICVIICKEENCNNYAKNIRHHHKKFTCLGNQAPGIYLPLVHVIPFYVLHARPILTSSLDLSCSDSSKQHYIIKPNLMAECINGN